MLESVCVFCGSSSGSGDAYKAGAAALASTLVGRGCRIVYGGSKLGLMGALAETALAAGGEVIGVIPRGLAELEIAHTGLSQLHVVSSMHERKALMAELSDAVIAMPGGYGTLDELFEVLTWVQLGLVNKPCGLFNINGYFDSLLAYLDHAVSEQFLHVEHRAMLVSESEAGQLLNRLEQWQAPGVAKIIV